MKRRENRPPTAAEKATPCSIVGVDVVVARNIGTSSGRTAKASIMEMIVVVGHSEFK